MGFCYPGRDGRGADRPPRPECAPLWHAPLVALMPDIRLTLLIGAYAQAHYLGPERRASLTETVAAWRDYGPARVPLPHPSWRNTAWLKRNPWFETELVPEVRSALHRALGCCGGPAASPFSCPPA
jgi:uracil-DNA glycosylase